MVRTLRAFGGKFAQVPVIAVIGRAGPPLRQGTRSELERLGVRIVRADPSSNPATWLNYANKIAAVATADRLAETGQIAWFDSDMFILKEPAGILLGDGQDLAAQCHPWPPAVLDGDATHVGFWTKLCHLFDVDFSDVPWTRAAEHLPLQKLNFTSGLFTWRRGQGFAEMYAEGVRRLLGARIAQVTGEFFTVDQVVFTPLIVRAGLRWRPLSIADHSIVLGSFLEKNGCDAPCFDEARVLHYSNSFASPFRKLMEDRLECQVPAFWRWLDDQRLDLGAMPPLSAALARMLRSIRGARYRMYGRSVVRTA